MNFVYFQGKLTPLSPSQLVTEVSKVCPLPIYSENDFQGASDRVQKVHCNCNGNGEFELLPPKKNEFRRYVTCRLCGTKTAL